VRRETFHDRSGPAGVLKWTPVLLWLLVFLPGALRADRATFERHFRFLSQFPHRLAGSENDRKVREYIIRSLQEAGFSRDKIIVQPFEVVRPYVRPGDCRLERDGRRVPIFPLRPNVVQAAITPASGITGPVVYLGKGETIAGGLNLSGKIAMLDYDCGMRWHDAFAHGARAVLFLERCDDMDRYIRKFYYAPADLPRFFIREQDARAVGLLNGNAPTVTLYAQASWDLPAEDDPSGRRYWRRLESANIIAQIDPAEDSKDKGDDSAIIIGCEYDSYGEVPQLAVNYRKALNAAALLDLASTLRKLPSRRKVLLCFFGDGATNHHGARTFYYSIIQSRENKSGYASLLAAKIQYFHDEKERLQKYLEYIESNDDLFAGSFEYYNQLIKLYKSELQFHIAGIREKAIFLSQAIRRKEFPESRIPAKKDELNRLNDVIRSWNELNRDIKKRRLAPKNRKYYEIIRKKVLDIIHTRLEELDAKLATLEAGEKIGNYLKNGKEDTTIIAHIALDLSEQNRRWGFSIFGILGPYKTILKGIETAVEKADKAGTPLKLFYPETVAGAINPQEFYPLPPSTDADLAISAGAFGFTIATLNCRDPLYGSPFERFDPKNMANFEDQLDEVRTLLVHLIPEENFSAQQPTPDNRRIMDLTRTVTGEYGGPMVRFQQFGTALADYPCRGAVAALDTYTMNMLVPDFDYPALNQEILVRSDQNGHMVFGPVRRWRLRHTIIRPGPRGEILGMDDNSGDFSHTHVVFQGNGGYLFNIFNFYNQNFRGWIAPSHIHLMKAVGNLSFRKFHVSLSREVMTFYVWGKEDTQMYHVGTFMLLNLDEEDLAKDKYGKGFPVRDGSWKPVDVEKRSAHDLYLLDEHRLKVLRRKNIVNESLEVLHGKTEDLLKAGKKLAAMICEWRVYGPLKGSIDDIIKAAVILLLMVVPFAFVLERLVIGATTIYKQIAWFCVFFILTFGTLYAVHPAFDIAGTPIIIFLAFVIIIASSTVIFIIMQRFKAEIMRLQGLETSLHQADVSRFNTLLAAVALGISTMRRRPLRTALTSVTIILLTFTILCFSSFNTNLGVVETYKGVLCPDRSVLLHLKDWGVLNPRNIDLLQSLGGQDMKVFGRWWLSSSLVDVVQNREPLKVIVTTPEMSDFTALDAVMGIDPGELDYKMGLRECLQGDTSLLERDGIFLAPSIRERLGLKPGDTVYVRGNRFTFAGDLLVDRMTNMAHLDGSPFMPVDYSSIKNIMTSQDDISSVIESMDSTQFTSVPPEMVGLTSNENVRRLRGNLRSVVGYPVRSDVDLRSIAQDAALTFGDYVYVGLKDGVYAAYFTDKLSFTGVKDIIAPLLLGGLIIFMTMLASVADRNREIYTFSALGLAPPHVAGLFFAEAAVYAILGGLGGYLFSQVVVKVLMFMSEFGWVRVPELNPSSFTAVVTILIVMGVTMISTVYPAVKASKSANPGIQRTWRMPAPRGDVLDVTFPFTVSEYDLTGIVSFLKEHFVNFGDSTLGTFSAQNVEIFEDPDRKMPALRANIWLAPFDLGISEKFTLTSAPSEIEGIAEVKIRIVRMSGSPGPWYRSNRVFLEDLRRQFLIWRTVSAEHVEMYRRRTVEELERRKAEGEGDGPAGGGEQQAES